MKNLNPVVSFIYLCGVIFLGILLLHPVYLTLSVILSFIATLRYCKSSVRKHLSYLLIIIFLTITNPLLNTGGDTVIFEYFGRAYTFEALIYGFVLAMLFITVLNWFSCYTAVITSSKFIYIFGKILPASSLLFSMVSRFIHIYSIKARLIISSRRGIGLAGNGGVADTAKNAGVSLSALTSAVLEDSLTTANSMKARGYGVSKRTSYAHYPFRRKDFVFLSFTVILLASMFYSITQGATRAQFIPSIDIASRNTSYYLGVVSYTLLLILPTALSILEEIKWNILRHKI